MGNLYQYKQKIVNDIRVWVLKYQVNIAIVNIILIIMFLLRSVGYFHPYLPITIHMIVFIGVILSIILLGASTRALIVVSLIFLLSASMLRILKINVWSERTAMYSFEIYTVGVFQEILKLFIRRKKTSI